MLERSGDTWKLPTMAPAGLRREIEMVLKKKLITSNSCRPAGQKGKGEHCDR